MLGLFNFEIIGFLEFCFILLCRKPSDIERVGFLENSVIVKSMIVKLRMNGIRGFGSWTSRKYRGGSMAARNNHVTIYT